MSNFQDPYIGTAACQELIQKQEASASCRAHTCEVSVLSWEWLGTHRAARSVLITMAALRRLSTLPRLQLYVPRERLQGRSFSEGTHLAWGMNETASSQFILSLRMQSGALATAEACFM